MGQVGVVYRMMPTGVDVDMKQLAESARQAVPSIAKLRGMQVQDIAYGLKALVVAVQLEDAGGVVDQVEEALRKVPHVESVEVIDTSLI
ncbi:MAG: elongation factor 1-beta [Candidatus Thermoplasmatota archaeon]|jgi:translation elongation factor aEF-1 beta|nr:elongation factor 1-beta [Candidatus Thermoplasmatota archaeon]MCL5984286.1 elongation factor 1-beta [Candidatus Thermoplasmatota archaeon]